MQAKNRRWSQLNTLYNGFESAEIQGSRCRDSWHSKNLSTTLLPNYRDNSTIQKIFSNGTDVDDCRSMQKLEMPNSPRFLNVAELAELLKVKPRTIYEMVAQNRIPYRKPPGSNILRFDLDEILAWTKASTNK